MRGKAYQKGSAWHWEMVITFGDMAIDDPKALVVGDDKTSYISKVAAVKAMKKHIPNISKLIGDSLGVKSGITDYIDLTKGFNQISEEEFLNN